MPASQIIMSSVTSVLSLQMQNSNNNNKQRKQNKNKQASKKHVGTLAAKFPGMYPSLHF